MYHIKVNKKLLLLKMSYFFIFAYLGPIIGYLPTIAKQLGYSITTFGAMMTVVSMLSTIWAPLAGIIVDKFRVKKIFFVMALLGMGITSFSFLFVPKVPLGAIVEFRCSTKIDFVIHSTENNLPNTRGLSAKNNELVTCEFNCQDAKSIRMNNDKMGVLSDICDDWITGMKYPHGYEQIDVSFRLNDTERIENLYVFPVYSVRYKNTGKHNDNITLSTFCKCNFKLLCRVNYCTDKSVKDLATVTTYRGNVFNLWQFWIFAVVVVIFWICSATSTALINPICLDTLGEKSENYGKQKCWGSIGWGTFSIILGWITDLFSVNEKEKNYSPVFYSCIMLIICNLIITTKIKVTETNKSKGRWLSVYELFFKRYVIAFYVWSSLNTFFHTIITHYLFWYMEDLVSISHNRDQHTWIKTIQGFAQGIQCFGGEIPFFFWSGYIIKKMGHINCMALVLAAMAIRMYLYTVISNPAWVILIEILNGVSYALGFAVKMSYAKIMSPPDTTNTIIGVIGFFDCVGESVGSLLGGYLFDSYGGVWSFRFFAYCSALMCLVNIISNYFGLTKELKTTGSDAEHHEPTSIDN